MTLTCRRCGLPFWFEADRQRVFDLFGVWRSALLPLSHWDHHVADEKVISGLALLDECPCPPEGEQREKTCMQEHVTWGSHQSPLMSAPNR